MGEDLYTAPTDKALFPVKYPKKSVSFSVSADVIKDFNTFIEEANIKKSQTIEKLMINFLIQAGVRKKA